ncbi:MFS transporter [Acrocarpospora pleiomorpha]|uniref:MFS transporter n=2 Tax=Acrocarpospora pleiomorpha TaxID=90975 RepID=A0A5M3XHV4_9ACTN|nr:MFS transporter [Acrocarpospora pleiomorpha]
MTSESVPPARRSRKEVLAAVIGATVEGYDWVAYAVLAPYFAVSLFPGDDPVAQVISAYLVFAVGFIVRPVGAVVMGRLADRRGRKFALVVSVAMMAFGSLMLAAVPAADLIGFWAAVLVVLARCLQGVSISAELPTATTYAIETASPRRRYFAGSLVSSAAFLGHILVYGTLAILVATIGSDGLEAGGWRIGFAVGALLGLVAVWIRRGVSESPVFEKAVKKQRPRPWPILRAYRRQILAVMLLAIGGTTGNYFLSVSLPVYLDHAGVIEKEAASGHMSYLLVVLIAVSVAAGALADRFGGLTMARTGTVFLALATVPLTVLMASGVLPFVPGVLLYILGYSLLLGPLPALLPLIFPPGVRVVAVAVPNTIAVLAAGGSLPAIVEALNAADLLDVVPWFIAATALLSLVGAFMIRARDLQRVDTETLALMRTDEVASW